MKRKRRPHNRPELCLPIQKHAIALAEWLNDDTKEGKQGPETNHMIGIFNSFRTVKNPQVSQENTCNPLCTLRTNGLSLLLLLFFFLLQLVRYRESKAKPGKAST